MDINSVAFQKALSTLSKQQSKAPASSSGSSTARFKRAKLDHISSHQDLSEFFFLSLFVICLFLPHADYSHAHPVISETDRLLVKRAHEFIGDAVIQELMSEHSNSFSVPLEDSIREEIAIYTRKLSLYLSLIDKLMSACNNLRASSENKATN